MAGKRTLPLELRGFLERNGHRMTREEVAEKFGLKPKQVSNFAYRNGIKMKKSGKFHHRSSVDFDDVRLAILLIKDGEFSCYKIDKLLGLKPGYAHSIKSGQIRAKEFAEIKQ